MHAAHDEDVTADFPPARSPEEAIRLSYEQKARAIALVHRINAALSNFSDEVRVPIPSGLSDRAYDAVKMHFKRIGWTIRSQEEPEPNPDPADPTPVNVLTWFFAVASTDPAKSSWDSQ